MITLLTILLFCLAFFKKIRAVVLVIAVMFVGLNATGITATLLLKLLQETPVHDPSKVFVGDRTNSIIVLGSGAEMVDGKPRSGIYAQPRVLTSIKLFNQCKKLQYTCKLVFSGGDVSQVGRTEAELFYDDAVASGVSSDDIVLEKNSKNTWENAKFTKETIKDSDQQNLVLVTSGVHLKRSLLYFEHFGLKTVGMPSDKLKIISYVPNGYNFALSDVAAGEIFGLLRFKFSNSGKVALWF